jgi:anti-sigma regulatory factor (Ser/Thr protein kinase)
MTHAERRLRVVPPAVRPRVPLLVSDVAAVPESVTMLRHLVIAFAAANGVDGKRLGDIGLAVSEAVGNVIAHAYEDDENGAVHLAADVEEDSLEIVVADDGHGIRGGHSDGGLGVGLSMIAQLCSDFAIRERRPAGTEIWMRFVYEA